MSLFTDYDVLNWHGTYIYCGRSFPLEFNIICTYALRYDKVSNLTKILVKLPFNFFIQKQETTFWLMNKYASCKSILLVELFFVNTEVLNYQCLKSGVRVVFLILIVFPPQCEAYSHCLYAHRHDGAGSSSFSFSARQVQNYFRLLAEPDGEARGNFVISTFIH